MNQKEKHKKAKLLKRLRRGGVVDVVTAKKSVTRPQPENYYAEDYRGYKIEVVEITDGYFKGSLEVVVDNDDLEITWEYMPFGKDELESQLASCRREIDEDCATMLEIEREEKEELEAGSAIRL